MSAQEVAAAFVALEPEEREKVIRITATGTIDGIITLCSVGVCSIAASPFDSGKQTWRPACYLFACEPDCFGRGRLNI